MRVIAGKLGGRTFDTPHGHKTHPMSEKGRGALFNVLGDVEGLSMLDAFSGSGALAFEAISRGMSYVVAIDNDRRAHEIIDTNAKALEIGDELKIIKANAGSWLKNNPSKSFDIVIAAPPYDKLQLKVVEKVANHTKQGGIFVLDWPGDQEVPIIDGLKQLKDKNYGDAQLVFYRKTE